MYNSSPLATHRLETRLTTGTVTSSCLCGNSFLPHCGSNERKDQGPDPIALPIVFLPLELTEVKDPALEK